MTEINDERHSVLSTTSGYPLHLLGWKAFQDLCIIVAEECLRRPVQTFLPNNDAGRDGAFIGRWESADPSAGESTIQCKFTSHKSLNLSLSMLEEELEKARVLAANGLANDYIILTNHPVTGASELQIRAAFKSAGVGRCRVFGRDWIVLQIRSSPRLRIMVPRLYGMGDLSELLDTRAYEQAQLILSAMGNDLQKLVVTDSHRKSVRAISEHNLVLLLGAPAAGKSTIGASLAIGAVDIWQCNTIRATSPEDIQRHLNPSIPQFFWVDDAWGNTQYQRQTAEAWNQVFPLMVGAMRKGTRFLLTSRDYIWRAAQHDLKLQAIPVLNRSQVVINVQELSTQEKAQILYNHMKLGDQPPQFRTAVKGFLPEIAERSDFLPETARRLGSKFFAGNLPERRESVIDFFERPAEFLLSTISNLAADCRAAIAVIFMNGGKVRSPVSHADIEPAAEAFGVKIGDAKIQLESLNGSLLLLAQDEAGPYWTYKHPTVSDAYARYVAGAPELIEIYLHGAKAESIAYEVVCAGIEMFGAPVVIADSLHSLLAKRLKSLDGHILASFLSYRSNKSFSELMLKERPDLLDRLSGFYVPIEDDTDARLAATLFRQGLLPEHIRENFVKEVREAVIESADASFISDNSIGVVLTDDETQSVLADIQMTVLEKVDDYIERLKEQWDFDSDPEDYFDKFKTSMELLAVAAEVDKEKRLVFLKSVKSKISSAVSDMNTDYERNSGSSVPTSAPSRNTPLSNLFRDVDE